MSSKLLEGQCSNVFGRVTETSASFSLEVLEEILLFRAAVHNKPNVVVRECDSGIYQSGLWEVSIK